MPPADAVLVRIDGAEGSCVKQKEGNDEQSKAADLRLSEAKCACGRRRSAGVAELEQRPSPPVLASDWPCSAR